MISERNNNSEMVVNSKTNLPEYKVGNRIECSGYFGTIKYIGQVADLPATWIGVDWDLPERGKHNGTFNNFKYFEASFSTSGSFIRPEKVNFGQSAIASIKARYGESEDDIKSQQNQQQLLFFQQQINAPFLEMVGFEKLVNKLSNYDSLKVVNLRLQNINSSSEPTELKKLCPNIIELDISKNLISSWSVVFDICTQLDRLKWLKVSENRMEFPENYTEYKFPNLKVLICGFMRLTWDDVLKLSAVFPNLEELRAPGNSFTSLETPADNNFKQLQLLDLGDNYLIIEWSQICKLAVINSLEQLILENIGLRRIFFEEEREKIDTFDSLKKLSITQNLIDNWESIGELNKLKNLEDLRCTKNPILDTENFETRYQILTAKIGNLKILNGSFITTETRRGAEYDYIKKYGLEWLEVKNTDKKDDFLKRHNRYLELINKYGEPEESELKILPKAIKTTLVSVDLVYGNRTITRKLPQTLAVQKLSTLVQKLFQLEERPNLKYICENARDIEIVLDDDCKEIGYYSIQDGDKIIVEL